jgi:SAM-dependent methyltransferase
MAYTEINCLLCDEHTVTSFLNLGVSSLANAFLTEDQLVEDEAKYPLRVGFCATCSHVQLLDIVPPSEIFANYLYVSSASDTLVRHLNGLAHTVVQRCALSEQDLIVDVGCNDGTLLAGFIAAGQRNTLGIDPASNLAESVRSKGAKVLSAFFGPDSATQILRDFGPASVITMTNTFPHVPDLNGLMRAVDTLLRPDGTFVLEAHYLLDLLEQGAYDTIYHEHVSYWAFRPMQRLFHAHGFEAVAVERLPVHHGQLRVFVRRIGIESPEESVGLTEAAEIEHGLQKLDTFTSFASTVLSGKGDLVNLVAELRCDGRRVAGYGAPAKGNTLLGFLQMGPRDIDYICDRSPLKQGRYTPGMHIPVVPAERLIEDQPDYTILFAWNFAEEIMEQQKEYLARGGKFILPIPDVTVTPE